MPLFMDRHDVPGATAEETARNHTADLEIASQFDVNFFSYWHDAERGVVICLAKAPDPEAMNAAHDASHGGVSTEIIEVSEEDVVRFLGQVKDPADATESTSAFRAICFTDIVGSTSLLDQLGQQGYVGLLREHDLIVRNALLKWNGREVKHTGDGFMTAFDDVRGSLDWALEVRERFDTHEVLQIRVGMDAGEPVDRDADLFGAAVTTAARLCSIAEPQHIETSRTVRDSGIAAGFRFGSAVSRSLKGFSTAIDTFELLSS
ncbi:MAG: nickel-binding protein [Acidimicrobiia bacterium]